MQTISPTDDQRRALEWIAKGTADGARCFVLAGYAGTGKTWLIGQLVNQLKDAGRPFILMAPTGRAAKVLAKRTGAPAHTIHKVIYAMDGLKEYVENDMEGSETFKFYFDLKNNLDDARAVYIVDEASMVSDVYSEGEFFRFGSGYLLRDLLKYINLDHNDHDKRLIFVGDPAQLPPIGSNESPALSVDYLATFCGLRSETFEMTEVVRHRQESGILDIATTVRDAIRARQLNVLDVRADKPDVLSLGYKEMVDRYAALGGEAPPENAVIIGCSNRLVNDYNRDIRARYFPDAAGPTPGDRLVVVANNHKGDVSLMNGDLVRLVSAAPSITSRKITLRKKQKERVIETVVPLAFRDVEIEMDGEQGRKVRYSTTIIENLLDSPERDLSSDEQKALYIDFKTRNPSLKPGTALFKDAIRADKCFNALRVKYGYAMTCHKAQGGEWPHVFVDFTPCGGVFNMAYFRWAYTAITRAKERLYTVNAPHYDAITPTRIAKEGGRFFKIRDNLFVMSPDVLENTTLEAAPGENPFLRKLFLAVSSLLSSNGIAIEKLESCKYCEHYHFRRGDKKAELLLHYNAKEIVSQVMAVPGADEPLSSELLDSLSPLIRKLIVLEEGVVSGIIPAPAALDCEHEPIKAAYALLTARAGEREIAVKEAKAVSQYHLYCLYTSGGHQAAVDYFFDKIGRLTRATPRDKGTTSAALLEKVLRGR